MMHRHIVSQHMSPHFPHHRHDHQHPPCLATKHIVMLILANNSIVNLILKKQPATRPEGDIEPRRRFFAPSVATNGKLNETKVGLAFSFCYFRLIWLTISQSTHFESYKYTKTLSFPTPHKNKASIPNYYNVNAIRDPNSCLGASQR